MELKEEKERLVKEIDEENRAIALEDEKKAIEQIMSSNNNVTGAKVSLNFKLFDLLYSALISVGDIFGHVTCYMLMSGAMLVTKILV